MHGSIDFRLWSLRTLINSVKQGMPFEIVGILGHIGFTIITGWMLAVRPNPPPPLAYLQSVAVICEQSQANYTRVASPLRPCHGLSFSIACS